MKTLPENTYTQHTLFTRLGRQGSADILVRRLDYAICTDINGQEVSVTRTPTVEFHNDTLLYVVEPYEV